MCSYSPQLFFAFDKFAMTPTDWIVVSITLHQIYRRNVNICNPHLHLLTEREHIDMVEDLISGGVSSVYSKRLCRANNKFLPDYKPKNISSFIFKTDANNPYGGIMEKFPLPLCEFELFDKSEWTDDNALEILHRILNTPDDDPVGYIAEVDLSYPDSLHDLHSDFPLAPTR